MALMAEFGLVHEEGSGAVHKRYCDMRIPLKLPGYLDRKERLLIPFVIQMIDFLGLFAHSLFILSEGMELVRAWQNIAGRE